MIERLFIAIMFCLIGITFMAIDIRLRTLENPKPDHSKVFTCELCRETDRVDQILGGPNVQDHN
jgi:hypothetical protein